MRAVSVQDMFGGIFAGPTPLALLCNTGRFDRVLDKELCCLFLVFVRAVRGCAFVFWLFWVWFGVCSVVRAQVAAVGAAVLLASCAFSVMLPSPFFFLSTLWLCRSRKVPL